LLALANPLVFDGDGFPGLIPRSTINRSSLATLEIGSGASVCRNSESGKSGGRDKGFFKGHLKSNRLVIRSLPAGGARTD
jgi:hypothetical protein